MEREVAEDRDAGEEPGIAAEERREVGTDHHRLGGGGERALPQDLRTADHESRQIAEGGPGVDVFPARLRELPGQLGEDQRAQRDHHPAEHPDEEDEPGGGEIAGDEARRAQDPDADGQAHEHREPFAETEDRPEVRLGHRTPGAMGTGGRGGSRSRYRRQCWGSRIPFLEVTMRIDIGMLGMAVACAAACGSSSTNAGAADPITGTWAGKFDNGIAISAPWPWPTRRSAAPSTPAIHRGP